MQEKVIYTPNEEIDSASDLNILKVYFYTSYFLTL